MFLLRCRKILKILFLRVFYHIRDMFIKHLVKVLLGKWNIISETTVIKNMELEFALCSVWIQ